MTPVSVLNSGVDSLYFSASGHVIDGLTLCLQRMVEMASGERVPFSFDDAEPDMHLRLHGWRGYPFWISSPRFELYIGASKPFPAVYVQLHSAFHPRGGPGGRGAGCGASAAAARPTEGLRAGRVARRRLGG